MLVSALAHIGLMVLAAVGLPALHDPPDPFETAVPVTVTVVSERTEAKAPLPPEPPEPEPVAAEPPPAPEEPVETAALAPEPPQPEPQPLPEPEPPAPPEPEPAAAPLPPDPPEPEPPASDPKPAPLPQRPPQQQARAKPPPKPPEPAPDPPPLPRAAPDPPDELAALREAAREDDLDALRSALDKRPPAPTEHAEKAVFTVSEKHRLFRQLARCWHTIPGLAPSERHVVVLQVEIGADRRVTSIEAIDGKTSRSYRAARERAERALRHPFCEQLDVPSGKMALWKSLTLRFDPHRMQ